LTNHLRAWGGQIEWETTLAALTQESDHVTVRIKRADGEEEEFNCKWVIGCDGAHSSVRHFLGLAFDGKKYPEYYVLADVEFETSLDISEFYIFSSGQSIGGFHPFSKEGARIFADVDESAQTLPDLNQIQSMLDARRPGSVKVTKLNWISMHHVHQRQVKDYRHGRVFLAGDAAHVHSPASGQGMNLGIQDAFNLAWKLALVHQGLASERLLDSYSPERRNVGRKVLTMTDFFTRINTMPTKVAQKVRNIVGPMIAKNDFVRQRYRTAVTQLSANYKGRPIVEDHLSHPEASAAGDRAADAVFVQATDASKKLRLYELLRDQRHHLFMLAGPHPTAGDLHNFQELRNHVATNYPKSVASHVVFEQLEAMPGPEWAADALFDCDRSMLNAYALNCPALLLIRPDGFVGFRSSVSNQDTVQKYLERVLKRHSLHSAVL
jgi:2-polyprenyl-6-methoxyphenol hydroxylase-like FAD-dependent oxidoreductase